MRSAVENASSSMSVALLVCGPNGGHLAREFVRKTALDQPAVFCALGFLAVCHPLRVPGGLCC